MVEGLATHLVGRDAELQALERVLDAVSGGSAPVVEIVGEPGIGKTRLLGELCKGAEERGHLVLTGRAAEFERDLPFGVFVDALDDYLGSLQPRTFERIGQDHLSELASIFPALSRVAVRASGELPTERYRAHRAVRILLEGLGARRPIVLALDDLHWADAAAVELISHLLRSRPSGPVLVLLALRSGQAPARLGAALEAADRAGAIERLELAPLTRVQAETLVGGAVDPGMADVLYEVSGGNPFYLEQLLRSAGPDALRADQAEADADVPPAVAAALARELERLSPIARTVVEAAAVVGEPFEPDLVGETAGLTEGDVLAVVDELLDVRLIARTEVPRRFRFRHPIVRHAVYESAKFGWRTESHRRAIDALARRGAKPAALAPHVERSACAGDAVAISVLTDAGRAAMSRSPGSAARWFAAALRLLPDVAENAEARIRLLTPLAEALGAAGRLEESLAALDEADRTLPEHAPERMQLIIARAGVEDLLGRYDAASARLERALAAGAALDWDEQAALKLALAANRFYIGDFAGVLTSATEALEIGRTHGYGLLTATAAALLSFAECGLGRVERAEPFRMEAAALIDGLDDDALAARLDAPYWLGWSECFLDRYDDALGHLERGIEVSRATGQRQLFGPMMLGLAYVQIARGGLGEARETADAAIEAAHLGEDARGLSWALFQRCWIEVLAGNLEAALRCGEESMALAEGLDEGVLSASAAWPLAAAALESGDPGRCVELILGSIGGEELPWVVRGVRPLCYELLTRAELDRGRPDAATRWAERAAGAAAAMGPGTATAYAHRARAHVLLVSGSAAAAAREALAAASDADLVGARLEAARSRTLAGRALAAAGEAGRAAGELEAAEAQLAVFEARRYRDETAKELRRLGHAAPRRERARRRANGSDGLPSLSDRELEVAKLVARGKTNRQIAAEIFLSEKTVESHLSHIFSKLGVRSRSAVAAEVTRQQ